jgi:hypothetical protein
MKSYKRWMAATMLLALAATGMVVFAQDKQSGKAPKAEPKVEREKVERDMVMRVGSAELLPPGQGPDAAGTRMWFGDEGTTIFIASEMMSGERAVKGAPYSAQAVTETIQTLADGNRIVRKTSASVYRDSEGRTRNDQAIGDIAPYATAMGEPSQVILINDPVSSTNYALDPRTRTARKMSFMSLMRTPGEPKVAGDGPVSADAQAAADKHMAEAEAMRATVEVRPATGQRMRVLAPRAGAIMADAPTFNLKVREPKIEQLGKQTIEGVEAEGQRATITIPAGEIGNEMPILIVSESWYSPELQVTVMSRHSDPRMGEMVYRLTNINRAEPAHSLFEVPSDYTVKETVEPKMKMLLDRERQRSRKPADKQND